MRHFVTVRMRLTRMRETKVGRSQDQLCFVDAVIVKVLRDSRNEMVEGVRRDSCCRVKQDRVRLCRHEEMRLMSDRAQTRERGQNHLFRQQQLLQ